MSPPLEWVTVAAEWAGAVIEFLALALLVGGILLSLGGAATARLRGQPRVYGELRRRLAAVTLLGLELLVAADIVATIAAPLTLEGLGVLALIVVIRTFLSFALEVEMEGRWPWRRNQGDQSGGARGPAPH